VWPLRESEAGDIDRLPRVSRCDSSEAAIFWKVKVLLSLLERYRIDFYPGNWLYPLVWSNNGLCPVLPPWPQTYLHQTNRHRDPLFRKNS